MNKTDNSLRAQTIMLTMKALEVISKALDIIAADEATDISHGMDTGKHGVDTDVCQGTDTDISHRTDTELTRRGTDISHGTDTELTRKDTDESLCAATPLPSRGKATGRRVSGNGAGGGVCISLTDNKLVTPSTTHPLAREGSGCAFHKHGDKQGEEGGFYDCRPRSPRAYRLQAVATALPPLAARHGCSGSRHQYYMDNIKMDNDEQVECVHSSPPPTTTVHPPTPPARAATSA